MASYNGNSGAGVRWSMDTAENQPSKVSSFIPTQAIKFHIFIPLQVLLPPGGAPGESGAVPSVAEARPSTVFFLRPASDLSQHQNPN